MLSIVTIELAGSIGPESTQAPVKCVQTSLAVTIHSTEAGDLVKRALSRSVQTLPAVTILRNYCINSAS